jgi:site-specific DNA-methyltransferase (adenine-specific)
MKVTDKITITQENNMLLMARYPDNYFDLAIVDPPYGIGEDGKKNHSRGKQNSIKKKSFNCAKAYAKLYTPKNWDKNPENKVFFNELKRVSKNQIIWGANHFIENLENKNSSCWIVWNKENGNTDFADCELAWTSFKKAVRMFSFKWSGMLQGDMKNKENRMHPTQKPVALYKWLLDKYAKKGDKIIDTHLGSGSIAIACHDYGFELTACELDKEYYDKAIQRIVNHTNQTKLF